MNLVEHFGDGAPLVQALGELLRTDGLARIIPSAVDALTPGGRLPSGEQLDQLDLGATLSGVDVAGLLR